MSKIGNSTAFSAQNLVISKKKKVFTEIKTDLNKIAQNRKFKRFFSPKTGDLQKRKKKGLSPKLGRIFRPKSEIQTLFQAESRHLLHHFGTQFPLGGLFSFFQQKSAQKHQKRAILHTLRANGGGGGGLESAKKYEKLTYINKNFH